MQFNPLNISAENIEVKALDFAKKKKFKIGMNGAKLQHWLESIGGTIRIGHDEGTVLQINDQGKFELAMKTLELEVVAHAIAHFILHGHKGKFTFTRQTNQQAIAEAKLFQENLLMPKIEFEKKLDETKSFMATGKYFGVSLKMVLSRSLYLNCKIKP